MNKTTLMSLAFLLGLFVTGSASADMNPQDIDMESIKAACTEESKEALYPQEYVDQCVEEKVQALKEEREDQNPEKS